MKKQRSRITFLQILQVVKLPTSSCPWLCIGSNRMAVPLSFSPMVSCSALIMQRLQLRKNCYLNLTFTLLYACRIAFLHRTPLSRQIFCSSIGRIPRRKLGSTAWICRKDIRTFQKRNLWSWNTSLLLSNGGMTVKKSQSMDLIRLRSIL